MRWMFVLFSRLLCVIPGMVVFGLLGFGFAALVDSPHADEFARSGVLIGAIGVSLFPHLLGAGVTTLMGGVVGGISGGILSIVMDGDPDYWAPIMVWVGGSIGAAVGVAWLVSAVSATVLEGPDEDT